MCDEYIKLLKPALTTLSINCPSSDTLQCLLERGFNLISQQEAYEVLRFILSACGQLEKLNVATFSVARWKSVDPYTKKKIEKCKNLVFDTLKIISKENKFQIPKLKKSDLLLPHCVIFYSTCLFIANYALSYQLGQQGLYFWPRKIQQMKILLSNIQEEDPHSLESEDSLSIEIETLESAISEVMKNKKEFNVLLSNLIDKCNYKNLTPDFVEQGSEQRSDLIVRWKCETDELHKKNVQRLNELAKLNEQLCHLSKLMSMKERSVINGEEILKNIPTKVKNIAESNGLHLSIDNQLNLPNLFKTVQLSIPKEETKRNQMIEELLKIEPPKIDFELLKKLEALKTNSEKRLANFYNQLGENVKAEANQWIEEFLFTVPKIDFIPMSSSSAPRNPIFNYEKLKRSVQPSSGKVPENKVTKKRIPVRKDPGQLKKLFTKRKSISLVDLANLSAVSYKSSNSEKMDLLCESTSSKLCSTPKENYSRTFMYEKSISPISAHSAKDRCLRNQGRMNEFGAINDSLLSENDMANMSLLNSYLSTDLDSNEKKQDTFEFTTSVQDISLDPTPSRLSISLNSGSVEEQ